MKGLILAGGKGTRLRPLTINTPKPIVPVANAPFLLYQIDLMRSAGIQEIILSLSYQPRKIEDLLKDGSDYGVWISYAVFCLKKKKKSTDDNVAEFETESGIISEIVSLITFKHHST